MSSAFICGAVRTPFAIRNSYLERYSTAQLASLPLADMVKRNPKLDWRRVDRLYVGSNNKNLCTLEGAKKFVDVCVDKTSIERNVSVTPLGWLHCTGMAAIERAAGDIGTGASNLSVVIGVSSSSKARGPATNADYSGSEGEFKFTRLSEKAARRSMLAKNYAISNENINSYIVAAYGRTMAARQRGFFDRECMLISNDQKLGGGYFSEDELDGLRLREHGRRFVDSLVDIHPSLHEGFAPTVDGSCCLLVASMSGVEELGLRARARVLAHAVVESPLAADSPYCIPAIRKVFAETGLKPEDLDVIEVGEVCAVEAISVMKDLGVPLGLAKLNGSGGDLAIGEATGASSARLVVTAINSMQSKNLRYALCAASSNSGHGIAIILENTQFLNKTER